MILLRRLLSPANDTFTFSHPILALSPFALTVLACQLGGFLLMLLIQYVSGVWVYSMTPLLAPSGGLNLPHLLEVAVLAPLREELVFRGILVSTFYRRVGGQAPDRKLRAILMSALFFGAVHAVNLLNPAFSKPYVIAQVVFGVLVGAAYGCELALGSLWGCIVLHMVNNLASSVVDMQALNNHPLIWAAFAESLLVYACLCWLGARAVQAKGVCRWSAVDGMGCEALPYRLDDEGGERKLRRKKRVVKKGGAAEDKAGADGEAEEEAEEAAEAAGATEAATATVAPASAPAGIRGRRGRKVD